jgi:SAM-dependent methyltransferase
MRGLLDALSRELLGASLALPEFPRIKSLRGLGLSDSPQYADRLADKLDYRNTYFHREPFFDITRVDEAEFGRYDFLLASEVFEHVPPPAEVAFANAFRLLRQGGVLVFTVPYSLDPATAERFPGLHQYGLAQVGGRTVLVNRTKEGELRVTDDLVFHISFGDPALEMREFSEADLKASLAAAGFTEVRIFSEDFAPYGIVRSESWSLPIAARKGPFALSRDAARDVLEHWQELDRAMRLLGKSWWFRIGRKLGRL